MPLNPDVIVEFAIGPTCPPSSSLASLSSQLGDRFLPSLGSNRRTLAVCGPPRSVWIQCRKRGYLGRCHGFLGR